MAKVRELCVVVKTWWEHLYNTPSAYVQQVFDTEHIPLSIFPKNKNKQLKNKHLRQFSIFGIPLGYILPNPIPLLTRRKLKPKMMKYPTVLFFFSALFFLNFSNGCPACLASDTFLLSTEEIVLRDELRRELIADQLVGHQEGVKIEFEFHDLFVNEVIPDGDLMVKYQSLLRMHGIQAGPQRQIHLFPNGKIEIGDYDDWGQLIGEPIRLGKAVARWTNFGHGGSCAV